MTTDDDAGRQRPHWRWILLCTLGGVAILGLAELLNVMRVDDVLTGALVNIGSALLFAWVLFWLESRFTRRVESTVASATAASEARQEERTRTLIEGRLDDLRAQLQEARAADEAEARARLNAVVEHLVPSTVEVALQEAIQSALIDESGLTVPAFRGARSEFIRFWWGTTNRSDPESNWGYEYTGILVEVEVSDADEPAVVESVCSVEWPPDSDIARLDRDISTALRRAKKFELATALDWTYIFERLMEMLQYAEQLRSGSDPLGGQPVELITKDWVLTSADVERLSDHLRIPRRDIEAGSKSGIPLRAATDIEAPSGTEPSTWEVVVDRVARHVHYGPVPAQDVWTGYNDETPF